MCGRPNTAGLSSRRPAAKNSASPRSATAARRARWSRRAGARIRGRRPSRRCADRIGLHAQVHPVDARDHQTRRMDRVVAGPVRGSREDNPLAPTGATTITCLASTRAVGQSRPSTTRSRSKRRATRTASRVAAVGDDGEVRAARGRPPIDRGGSACATVAAITAAAIQLARIWAIRLVRRAIARDRGPRTRSSHESRVPSVRRSKRQFRQRGDDGRVGPLRKPIPGLPPGVSPRVAAGHVPATSAREISCRVAPPPSRCFGGPS